MHEVHRQKLYTEDDLPQLLRLTAASIEHLVSTGQLRSIRICGETRFSAREIDAFLETYAQISRRQNAHDHNS